MEHPHIHAYPSAQGGGRKNIEKSKMEPPHNRDGTVRNIPVLLHEVTYYGSGQTEKRLLKVKIKQQYAQRRAEPERSVTIGVLRGAVVAPSCLLAPTHPRQSAKVSTVTGVQLGSRNSVYLLLLRNKCEKHKNTTHTLKHI